MKGSAPNSPLTGFHWRPVTKPKPNCRTDIIESDTSATIIASTTATTNNPIANISKRKIASPVLPVGESTRRQSEYFRFKTRLSGVVALITFPIALVLFENCLSERCASGSDGINLGFSSLHDVVG